MAKQIDIARLCGAIRSSRLATRRYREERREMVRQYVGKHWFEEGSLQEVYVNLLGLFVRIITTSLIAKNPRAMISTFNKPQKATASAMQLWANREIEGMRLASSLQRIVVDALFSIGIGKVALAMPKDSSRLSWNLPAGAPFVERIDLDDWAFDQHARDLAEMSWTGHRCRVPLDAIRDSKLYSQHRKDLTAAYDEPYNQEGDERIGMLGRGYQANMDQEFLDWTDIWEIYIPGRRLVVTIADEDVRGGNEKTILREQEWLGPDQGPYYYLGFGIVPGNLMPKAPVQDLIGLHEAVNRIYRKLIRQCDRQKQVTFASGGASEDGERVIRASDGEAIKVDHPDKIAQVDYGGPSQAIFQVGQHLKDVFSWLAGNLDIMGGLSPQSKTATQDKLLNENSSRSVTDMQDRTLTFTSDVIEALCWYWHHDPVRTMVSEDSIPGVPQIRVKRQVSPEQRRQVRFTDLGIQVDPYSLQHQTPQSRAAALTQVFMQVISPLMGILERQGVSVDMSTLLAKLASLMDMPDLAEIITIREPPQADAATSRGGSGSQPPGQPHEYIRRSLGAESQQNKEESIRNWSASGNGQPSTNGTVQP